jgi:tetratricopeptide (TPR) repeat protein
MLVHEAYRLEDEGDLEAALDRMRKALRAADDPGVVTTLDEHLHLPHLLQRMGRLDEARRAFGSLLEAGYADQLDIPSVQWIERGLIYNAMRRAYARKGLAAEAACYEGLSYLTDAYGRFLDTERQDASRTVHQLDRATAEAIAWDMVASVADGPSEAEVTEVLYDAIERFGDEDGDVLLHEVERALGSLFGVEISRAFDD